MYRIARTVTVDGDRYVGGSEVPAEIAAKITNPDAWPGGEVPHIGVRKADPEPAPAPEPAPEEPPAPRARARKSTKKD